MPTMTFEAMGRTPMEITREIEDISNVIVMSVTIDSDGTCRVYCIPRDMDPETSGLPLDDEWLNDDGFWDGYEDSFGEVD